jgi:integrase
LGAKQVKLADEREEAFARYHKLMQKADESRTAAVSSDCVVAILEGFLEWCSRNREPRTYEWYKDRLQSFARTIPRKLPTTALKPFHIEAWTNRHQSWNPGMRRGAMQAVQRAMNWGVKQGYLDRSPLVGLEKPPQGKREVVVEEDTYRRLLDLVQDQEFRDLVTTCWETGCRPQEILLVAGKHVDADHRRWVFPPQEAKGKRRHRIVYHTDTSWAITQRVMLKYQDGPLFRNTDGRPWTPDSVGCRFYRLQKRLGRRYCLYHFRHTWITRMLKGGVDPLTLATLAGHVDTTMLTKFYAHVAADTSYLQRAARALSA